MPIFNGNVVDGPTITTYAPFSILFGDEQHRDNTRTKTLQIFTSSLAHVKSVKSPCGFGSSWMKPNWIFLSMSLIIGPFDGLGLEGVPWLDVGLVGVKSIGLRAGRSVELDYERGG